MEKAEWLTTKQVAEQYPIAAITLSIWRTKGEGPTYSKLGSKVLYKRENIERFLKEREVKHD